MRTSTATFKATWRAWLFAAGLALFSSSWGQASPGVAVLGQAVSGVTVPGVAVLGQAVPGVTVPGVAVLGQAVPGQTVPGQTVPGQTVRGGSDVRAGASPSALYPDGEMAKATSLVSADSALASVETTSVPIGCPVIVNIDIASASSDFVPPSALTLSFPDWEVCESQRLQLPSQGSQQRWRYRVALQGWQLGKQTIPPLEIGGLTTSPLTVEITRPEGTSLALSAALPWEAWRERFGNPLALGAAALAALLAIGGVWEVARYQRRPERAIPRQVCTDLMRAQTLGEEGWALAEKAVRVYLTWKLAIGEQELTLKELAALAEPAWAELLTELEARKYRAEREDGACQSWVGRALALATPSQEGGK